MDTVTLKTPLVAGVFTPLKNANLVGSGGFVSLSPLMLSMTI